MENFDEFWEKNKDDYITYAKKIALADFNEIAKFKAGKFVADINIDSDDDFYFEKGLDYKIFGNTKKEVRSKCIDFISNLKISRGNQEK